MSRTRTTPIPPTALTGPERHPHGRAPLARPRPYGYVHSAPPVPARQCPGAPAHAGANADPPAGSPAAAPKRRPAEPGSGSEGAAVAITSSTSATVTSRAQFARCPRPVDQPATTSSSSATPVSSSAESGSSAEIRAGGPQVGLPHSLPLLTERVPSSRASPDAAEPAPASRTTPASPTTARVGPHRRRPAAPAAAAAGRRPRPPTSAGSGTAPTTARPPAPVRCAPGRSAGRSPPRLSAAPVRPCSGTAGTPCRPRPGRDAPRPPSAPRTPARRRPHARPAAHAPDCAGRPPAAGSRGPSPPVPTALPFRRSPPSRLVLSNSKVPIRRFLRT